MTAKTFIIVSEMVKFGLLHYVENLPVGGEVPMQVTIQPKPTKRSLSQNARMHVMWHELANHLGYTGDELKEIMKLKYGPQAQIQFEGELRVIPKPSAKYTKAESSAMMEHIQRLAAECGCVMQGNWEG